MRVILNGIVPEEPCSLRRFCDDHNLDLNVVTNRRGNAYRVYFRTTIDSSLYGFGETVLAAGEDLVNQARGAAISLPGLTSSRGEPIKGVAVPSKLYLGRGAKRALAEMAKQLAPTDTDEDFGVSRDTCDEAPVTGQNEEAGGVEAIILMRRAGEVGI